MTKAVRLRARPTRQGIRVSVFLPSATGGEFNAGTLQLSETLWRLLLYPLLSAGAARHGVTLSLEP